MGRGNSSKQAMVSSDLFKKISALVKEARNRAIQNVNMVMVQAYWQVGQEIQSYQDMIKAPYILEFTGLSPTAKLYETNLEQALLGTPQCQDINM